MPPTIASFWLMRTTPSLVFSSPGAGSQTQDSRSAKQDNLEPFSLVAWLGMWIHSSCSTEPLAVEGRAPVESSLRCFQTIQERFVTGDRSKGRPFSSRRRGYTIAAIPDIEEICRAEYRSQKAPKSAGEVAMGRIRNEAVGFFLKIVFTVFFLAIVGLWMVLFLLIDLILPNKSHAGRVAIAVLQLVAIVTSFGGGLLAMRWFARRAFEEDRGTLDRHQ
jgi:hypothetical protein